MKTSTYDRSTAPSPTAARRAKEAVRGAGHPVAASIRAAVEHRSGHDLSDVRVHEGPRVRAAATGLGAAAFTLGRDIALGGDADTDHRQLLTHELTHVVQQSDAVLAPGSAAAAEREAGSAARGGAGLVGIGRPVAIACSAADWLRSTPNVGTWSDTRLRAELTALEEWMAGHASESVDAARIFEARSVVSAELERRGGGSSTTAPVGTSTSTIPARADPTPAPTTSAESPGVLGTIGGALMGEWEEDPTIGMIALDTGISLIPVVDQVADVRDVLAHLYWMIERGQHNRVMRWVGLTLSLIGAIPEIGTAIKGASKAVIRGVREALGHLDEIVGISRRLLPQGGSLRRFLEFVRGHWSQWSAFGANLWHTALDRARSSLDSFFGALVPGRARLVAAIADVRRRSSSMLSNAYTRLLEMIDDGMNRLIRATSSEPELVGAGAARLESRAASATDDVAGSAAHVSSTSPPVSGGTTSTGTGGLTEAQRSGTHAPEIASGVARAHVRPLGALLGAPFDTPGLQRLEHLWLQVTNPGEVASLTLGNSRRLFNNQRRRFWAAVADDPAAARLFADAGMVFGRRGSAPLYVLADGRRVRATIDHVLERQSAPGRALDPTNLQLSFTRENTVLLRLINALDPFQGASSGARLAEHEADVASGIDDVIAGWADIPGP